MSEGEDRQRAGQVVESVTDDIGRQQRGSVDLQRQQIADRVRVLRAVQAVGRHAARLGIVGGRAVERSLQRAAESVVGCRLRPGPAGRRHHAAAQLLDHRLPAVGGRADIADVERVERQPAGLQPLVVAGDAVAVEQRRVGRPAASAFVLRCRRARGGQPLGGRQAPRDGQRQRARDEPKEPDHAPHQLRATWKSRAAATGPPRPPWGRSRSASGPLCPDPTGSPA